MIPHNLRSLQRETGTGLLQVGRISSGFYISDCLEYRP
jgi:magnesium-protoporphyrin O-methyltransferase